MTAIAAIRTETEVLMGGDSASVGGYRLGLTRYPKVFWCGQLLIGYTSSFRMAQLLQYGLDNCLHVADLEPPGDPRGGMEFMVRQFVPRVRWLFKKGGFLNTDNGVESAGTFLVAWGNQLFEVQDDLQVAQEQAPFVACGCGLDVVYGALEATESLQSVVFEMTPRQRIEVALQAAERRSAGVRGPFVIRSTAERTGEA